MSTKDIEIFMKDRESFTIRLYDALHVLGRNTLRKKQLDVAKYFDKESENYLNIPLFGDKLMTVKDALIYTLETAVTDHIDIEAMYSLFELYKQETFTN